jgi:hypothetical protein
VQNPSAEARSSRRTMTTDDQRADLDDEELVGEPEAWAPWESRLVFGSLLVGVIGLVILGWLVDRFILP